ncbi:MAG: MCP four helix bundle domain-containing protein [Nitritalea sp.]
MTKGFRSKLTLASVLSVIVLAIVYKNYLERKNFEALGQSFASVYEDRLVTESLLFDISERLYEVKLAINHCDVVEDPEQILSDIAKREDEILARVYQFERTLLTLNEADALADFKRIVEDELRIERYERIFNTETNTVNTEEVRIYNAAIRRALTDLERLSEIQLDEGQRLVKEASVIINRSRIWAQFEVAGLFLLLVLVYYLLYSSRYVTKNWVD